jgi:hypothetical protein
VGYKKIQEKRKELQAQSEIKSAFFDAAKSLDDLFGTVEKTRQQISQKIGALKPSGVSELEAYKTSLLAVVGKLAAAKPPSIDPVWNVVRTAEKEVENMVSAYEDKLAAACPKDVGPGMTFKDPATKRIFEVKTQAEKAKNENLQGDQSFWFKCDLWKDGAKTGESSVSLAQLKKMKFLKTQ